MVASLLWLTLGVLSPAPAPAPAPVPAPVSSELADPFAPSMAQPRIPPGRVESSNPPLLSPFAPRYLDVKAPARQSVRSPFEGHERA